MTKQDVRNNIRYNENLVNQYENTISRLRSKVKDQNAQINQYISQISQLKSQIKSLKSQIDELEQLKSKCQKMQNDFASRQTKRISKFNLNFSRKLNVGFISSYINGMRTLLSGNEYKRAYNSLTSAINTISDKIKSIQREICCLMYPKTI